MARKLSSYLKLHVEDSCNEDREAVDQANAKLDLSELLDAFSSATGWVARPVAGTPHHPAGQRFHHGQDEPLPPLRQRVQLVSTAPIDGQLDYADDETSTLASEEEAWTLFAQIDALIQQLHEAEQVIERQETQLATAVGVSVRPDEAEILTAKLQESLQRAMQQTHSDAAAIYLLDDATSELKMRCCQGLPTESLAAPARSLRGSLADLEALMGNAVLVENTALAPEWNCPEDFAAALCLPIGSPTMPQGTLWLWSEHVRDFESNDIEAAKQATDKVLVDIERSVLADEVLKTRARDRGLEAASLVQASRLPDTQPLHEDYEIAGWTYQGQSLGGNFHSWNINKHQQIVAALGAAATHGPAGALVATSLQTVVETCWNSKHQPHQIMRRANDILWSAQDGDWRSSMAYVQIDPETGVTNLAVAGDIQAFIIGENGFRPADATPTLLAQQPDTQFSSQQLTLAGGEILVAASADVIGGLERSGLSQDQLLSVVREMQEEAVSDISDHLARLLPMQPVGTGTDHDRSLLIVRRSF